MRSSARFECVKSLIKFKRQEEVLNKSLDNFFDSTKLEPEILRVAKNERCSRMLERRKLVHSVQASILDIKNRMREIKSSVNDMREDRNIDVDSFREKLISLANKIREFKNNSPMESLTNEEIELEQDLRVFCRGLAKYEKRNSRECKKSTESTVFVDFRDYGGARDFDALIAKTGHTQNWSESDHLFFLKVRKNCPNVPSMVSAIRKKCPDLTAERIVNHEAWYKIYLDLREKQRSVIREWRERRESEKREKIIDKNLNGGERCRDLKTSERVTSDESVANDPNPRFIVSRSYENLGKMSNKCTCDKRELVKRWRADREKASSLESEQSRSEIESRRVLKENRRLARAKAIKTEVVTYRRKKMENTTSSSSASVTDLERIASKSKVVKLINCFRRQDDEFLKRRKALLQRKKSNPIGVLCNKPRSRSNIEQSTLLNPTKVWLEKCKAIRDPQVSSQGISYVKYIPKL